MTRTPRKEPVPAAMPVEAITDASIEIEPGQPEVLIRRGTLWPANHPCVQTYPEFFTRLGEGQIARNYWPEREPS